jgi:molecular chaperone DnaJ
VEVPSHLSGDQRKLFEQLAPTLGAEVRPQERSFLDFMKEVLGG